MTIEKKISSKPQVNIKKSSERPKKLRSSSNNPESINLKDNLQGDHANNGDSDQSNNNKLNVKTKQ